MLLCRKRITAVRAFLFHNNAYLRERGWRRRRLRLKKTTFYLTIVMAIGNLNLTLLALIVLGERGGAYWAMRRKICGKHLQWKDDLTFFEDLFVPQHNLILIHTWIRLDKIVWFKFLGWVTTSWTYSLYQDQILLWNRKIFEKCWITLSL